MVTPFARHRAPFSDTEGSTTRRSRERWHSCLTRARRRRPTEAIHRPIVASGGLYPLLWCRPDVPRTERGAVTHPNLLSHSTEESMQRTSCALLTIALGACSDQPQPTPPVGLAAHGAELGVVPRYDVRIIRSTLGAQTRGTGISNRGLVAGWSNLANGTRHAVVWNGE